MPEITSIEYQHYRHVMQFSLFNYEQCYNASGHSNKDPSYWEAAAGTRLTLLTSTLTAMEQGYIGMITGHSNVEHFVTTAENNLF